MTNVERLGADVIYVNLKVQGDATVGADNLDRGQEQFRADAVPPGARG